MAGRRAGAGLALAAVALSAAGCGLGGSTTTVRSTKTVTRTVTVTHTVTSTGMPFCTASQLSATFSDIRGSGAAGQIAYRLTLTDTSNDGCVLPAVPSSVILLDANGAQLPTRYIPAQVTESTPPATLEPGTSATATVRFSPTVPGAGDSQGGPCQPKAYTLDVAIDGGSPVEAPIKPPTSVCERGQLQFDLLKTG